MLNRQHKQWWKPKVIQPPNKNGIVDTSAARAAAERLRQEREREYLAERQREIEAMRVRAAAIAKERERIAAEAAARAVVQNKQEAERLSQGLFRDILLGFTDKPTKTKTIGYEAGMIEGFGSTSYQFTGNCGARLCYSEAEFNFVNGGITLMFNPNKELIKEHELSEIEYIQLGDDVLAVKLLQELPPR